MGKIMPDQKGYVYVLSNPAMPGVVKIGRSVNGGQNRASCLYATGVPERFVLEFEILVSDPKTVEAIAHESLHKFRVNAGREFFRVSPQEAAEAVINAHLGESDQWVAHESERGILVDLQYVISATDDLSYEDLLSYMADLDPEAIRQAKRRCKERRESLSRQHYGPSVCE